MTGTFYCNKCGAPNAGDAQFCSRCGTALQPGASSSHVPQVGVAPFTPTTLVVAGRYGGFWIRVIAIIVDAIIIRVVIVPFTLLLGGVGWFAGMATPIPHAALGLHLLGGGIAVVLAIAGGWIYEAFMLSSSYQATVGKIIFGMKVTDLYGNRISFGRATARHFAKWLSAMFLCFGFMMVGFTERKQGLHDIIAGTLVPRN